MLLLFRGFEKGLAGGGWRLTEPKTQQKNSRLRPTSPKGAYEKFCSKEAWTSRIGRISSRQPPLSANPFSKPLSFRCCSALIFSLDVEWAYIELSQYSLSLWTYYIVNFLSSEWLSTSPRSKIGQKQSPSQSILFQYADALGIKNERMDCQQGKKENTAQLLGLHVMSCSTWNTSLHFSKRLNGKNCYQQSRVSTLMSGGRDRRFSKLPQFTCSFGVVQQLVLIEGREAAKIFCGARLADAKGQAARVPDLLSPPLWRYEVWGACNLRRPLARLWSQPAIQIILLPT